MLRAYGQSSFDYQLELDIAKAEESPIHIKYSGLQLQFHKAQQNQDQVAIDKLTLQLLLCGKRHQVKITKPNAPRYNQLLSEFKILHNELKKIDPELAEEERYIYDKSDICFDPIARSRPWTPTFAAWTLRDAIQEVVIDPQPFAGGTQNTVHFACLNYASPAAPIPAKMNDYYCIARKMKKRADVQHYYPLQDKQNELMSYRFNSETGVLRQVAVRTVNGEHCTFHPMSYATVQLIIEKMYTLEMSEIKMLFNNLNEECAQAQVEDEQILNTFYQIIIMSMMGKLIDLLEMILQHSILHTDIKPANILLTVFDIHSSAAMTLINRGVDIKNALNSIRVSRYNLILADPDSMRNANDPHDKRTYEETDYTPFYADWANIGRKKIPDSHFSVVVIFAMGKTLLALLRDSSVDQTTVTNPYAYAYKHGADFEQQAAIFNNLTEDQKKQKIFEELQKGTSQHYPLSDEALPFHEALKNFANWMCHLIPECRPTLEQILSHTKKLLRRFANPLPPQLTQQIILRFIAEVIKTNPHFLTFLEWIQKNKASVSTRQLYASSNAIFGSSTRSFIFTDREMSLTPSSQGGEENMAMNSCLTPSR